MKQKGIHHSFKNCHSRRREGHPGFSCLRILTLKSKPGPVERSVTVGQPSFPWDRLRANQRLPHWSMHNRSCKNMSHQELYLLSTRLGVLREGTHFLKGFTKDNMWTSPLLRSRLGLWVSRHSFETVSGDSKSTRPRPDTACHSPHTSPSHEYNRCVPFKVQSYFSFRIPGWPLLFSR